MKLAALLVAIALLFAPVGIAAEEEDTEGQIHLGACEPKQTVTAPDGRRRLLFECDSGVVVIVPLEVLQDQAEGGLGPAIPPSEDAIRI